MFKEGEVVSEEYFKKKYFKYKQKYHLLQMAGAEESKVDNSSQKEIEEITKEEIGVNVRHGIDNAKQRNTILSEQNGKVYAQTTTQSKGSVKLYFDHEFYDNPRHRLKFKVNMIECKGEKPMIRIAVREASKKRKDIFYWYSLYQHNIIDDKGDIIGVDAKLQDVNRLYEGVNIQLVPDLWPGKGYLASDRIYSFFAELITRPSDNIISAYQINKYREIIQLSNKGKRDYARKIEKLAKDITHFPAVNYNPPIGCLTRHQSGDDKDVCCFEIYFSGDTTIQIEFLGAVKAGEWT